MKRPKTQYIYGMRPNLVRFPRFLALFLFLISVPSAMWAVSKTVVISQLYGAGGNTGASYNADYIELFNLGTTATSIDGWSIQYASATGTAISGTVKIPAGVTLQPGQYYLIAHAAGSVGANLPVTPDDVDAGVAWAATAGKLFLVNSSTTLASGTICSNSAVVDFVGFGSTASCYEGTGAAPAPSTTTADIRKNSCTDTDDNSADFTTGAIAPHNMSTTLAPCVAVNPFKVVAAASTNPVSAGGSTLLTATVTPATSPASTNIAVKADLSAFGGSSTQALYDDGTHGDATAGDNIFSYTLSVPGGQGSGANTINFSATDSQLDNSTTTLSLTVTSATLVPIHTIEGSTPGTSAYTGQMVATSGIVTGVRPYGFYLQARDSAADSDPTTSEGIFVYAGTGNVPGTVTVGTEVQLTGTVTIFTPTGAASTATQAETELTSPGSYTVLSTSNPLPAPITLTTTLPSPTGAINQLAHYQSMRVSIPSLTTTSGTDGTFTESTETYVSNGQFWGVVTNTPRPVREPGLEVLDPFTTGKPNTIARFDDNPEVFEVDSLSLNPGKALDVTSSTLVTGINGIIDLGTGYPVVMLETGNNPTVTGGLTPNTVSAAASNEVTLGDLNMERFYNTIKDTSGAVVITQEAYTRRLQKASLAIRNLFLSPDILAVEEVENPQTLQDVATQISTDAVAAGQTDPQYAPYLVIGNDSSGISVGFLVKPSKITVNSVDQIGKTTTYTPPGGSAIILNDRPPLVLHAGIKRSGATDYPVTVIVNHLKSLDDITTKPNTPYKREAQAEFLANLIQGYQSGGEHVISVGDYNAFEFNDGIVDELNIIRGIVTPSNQDVVPGPATALVTPALVDVDPTNLATGSYSYVYQGNAQSIDHILATSDIAPDIHVTSVHLNADFPVVLRNDATKPARTSDHDGFVAYLAVPGISITLNPTSLDFGTPVVGVTVTKTVNVSNAGKSAITIGSIAVSAGYTQTNTCGTSIAAAGTCVVTVNFTPTAAGLVTGTLTLTDNDITGTQTVSLTGTGAGSFVTPKLVVSPTNLVAGTNVQMNVTITGNSTGNTPSGTVTFLDGATTLGTATLSGGFATFSTTKLAVGSHSITAHYSGDAIYPAADTTPAVAVTVTAPPPADFTVTVANTQVILTNGQPSATTAVNVAMVNGFSSTVSFTCNNLPSRVLCTFTPATLSASGESTLTLTKNASATLREGPLAFGKSGGIALALLGLPLLLTGFRKRMRGVGAVLGMLLLALGMASLTGCGNGTTTAPGTATVTITATGGSITHTASFTLTIQ
ncbi:MAG TPA: Ig-like domain repeat protein [Acidobacteriaceae bacterium]